MQKKRLEKSFLPSLVFSILTAASLQTMATMPLELIQPLLKIDSEVDELEFRHRELRAEKTLEEDSETQTQMDEISKALQIKLDRKQDLLHVLRQTQLPSPGFQSLMLPGFKPQATDSQLSSRWQTRETLPINTLELFKWSQNPRFFAMPLHSPNYELTVQNNQGEQPLEASLSCSHPVSLRQRPGFGSKKGLKLQFLIWNSNDNAQKSHLQFSNPETRCELMFRPWGSRETPRHGVSLVPEKTAYPRLQSLQTSVEVCTLASSNESRDPSGLFFNSDLKSLGCPHAVDSITMLSDPYTAFDEKMKALTGAGIPKSVFDHQDLSHRIDFTHAPRLDLILVTTLQFKSDFVGQMLTRALKYHAQRGTMVRIMSTGILLQPKDKRMLDSLVAEGRGHVKYFPFSYKQKGSLAGSPIDRIHRTNHLKVLLGYSSSQPANNFTIVGGRNIRDSYYFRKIPDHSRYPELIQYQDKEEPFIHYVDLEVLVRSTELTRQVAMQVLGFLNRDSDTMRSQRSSYSLPLLSGDEMDEMFQRAKTGNGWARHFVSVPYVDGHEMEKLFVRMLDSSKKRIRLISPYFAPRPSILAALARAADRGVRVQVITRIVLAGDDIPKIAEDVNKGGINRSFQKMEVHEWMEPDSILHTKSLMIDDDLLYIGGTNINNRSFVHDLEGGYLFTGKNVLSGFEKLYDENYLLKSSRVVEKRKIGFLNQILIKMGRSYF